MGSVDTSRKPKACSPFTGAARLRELLNDRSKIVVCPGVYDGLTARLALEAGFDALYMVSRRLEERTTTDVPLRRLALGRPYRNLAGQTLAWRI